MASSTKKYTLGLSKIELGPIGEDGDMGSNLAQLGYTYQDSATFTGEDPELTEFYAEEVDDPVVQNSRAGKYTLNFQLMNPSADTMKTLMGGTVNTSTGAWEAPNAQPRIELSCVITPAQGFKFVIPRMNIVAKVNATLSKTGMTLIDVAGTVLTPTKSGVSKMTLEEISNS